MDFAALQHTIAQRWQDDLLPALQEYIAIPCQSPAFDPDWQAQGHMDRAVALMRDWARARLADVPGASVEVFTLPGRTPLLLVDIPGEGAPVLVYGHLDKQPPMHGWSHGRHAWRPSLEGERLYGRGGADDGYALFATVLAVQALRAQGLAHPRCIALIEACEESGSYDLPHYIEHLAPRIGAPAAVVALDAGCGSYNRLWLTTSLRGQVAGTLRVTVLEEGVHSGDASGVVASPLRIVRQLLARLEDADTGDVVEAFQVAIPQARRAQAREAAGALDGGLHAQLPVAAGLRPVREDPADEILNRAWRAQLAVTGLDGLPAVAEAAAVMVPALALKLSLRLPPTLDADVAATRLQSLLQADPPYGAKVAFQIDMVSQGWHAPASAPWLAQSLSASSLASFGAAEAWIGGGGGIPFLAMLGQRYPQAQFVVTGVLGPQSNAHGPNEFLHLPTARRITEVLARLLHDASQADV